MIEKELRDLRSMILGSQIRISNLALMLHKEQEHHHDIINIIDVALTKGDKNGF